MRVAFSLALLAAASAASGCATMLRGSTQSVDFETYPAGALVESYRGGSCYTPCSLRFYRKENPTVLITKDGYEPAQVRLRAHANRSGVAAAYGNILIGGGVGAYVDGRTKSFKGFIDPVRVVLKEDRRRAAQVAAAE